MLAKPIIYKESVYIYASRNRELIRIPTGLKSTKLNDNGLLNKSFYIEDYEAKNEIIKTKLKTVQSALDTYPHLTAKELTTYIKKGVLPDAPKEERQLTFLEVFEKFIKDSENGERLTEKGTVFSPNTIKTYNSVLTNLNKFKLLYDLSWDNINDLFYSKFCDYYWFKLGSYDNNTGKAVKIVKTCLNWAYKVKLLSLPINTKNWKSWDEDIEILVLYSDEIKHLYQMPINDEKLSHTRAIFLIGVFTCLRVEDLLSLTERDLQIINGDYYINTFVKKINKHIRIKLNPIGASIIQEHRNKFKTLLPLMNSVNFNINLKSLAAEFKSYLNENKHISIIGNDWNSDFKRIRLRKGKPEYEFIKLEEFISSHCMRRSGIINLLMMGLSPFEVQAISGHSLNSRDFAKYVKIANQVIEKKSVDAWSTALA